MVTKSEHKNRMIIRNTLNSTLKKNIGANFLGSAWIAVLGFVCVPFYIKYMGIESYGLVGIFTTLQVIFGLLDVGLGGALNREIARLSTSINNKQEMSVLLRTLEIIYWGIALLAGILVIVFSKTISEHWINSNALSSATINQALLLMGMIIVFQMPIGFYSGGLMGLQRQVLLNIVNIIVFSIRNIGAILVLLLASPTIQSFFLWQFACSILHAGLLFYLIWKQEPLERSVAYFRVRSLRSIWRFSLGISGITILASILTQTDKVILSKMLSLKMFGYYMLASMIAMSLTRIFSPLFNSIYPKFTQLVSEEDYEGLKVLYHQSSQFISFLIIPITTIIVFFSYEIIFIWTNDKITALNTYIVTRILICGTAINGLMNMPYALQLSHGWTRLSLLKTTIAVILIIPFMFLMTKNYAAVGAAITWLVLQVGILLIEIPLMHKKLLKKEMLKWYKKSVFIPVITCTLIVGFSKIVPLPVSRQFLAAYLVFITILAYILTALTTDVTKTWIGQTLNIRRKY